MWMYSIVETPADLLVYDMHEKGTAIHYSCARGEWSYPLAGVENVADEVATVKAAKRHPYL